MSTAVEYINVNIMLNNKWLTVVDIFGRHFIYTNLFINLIYKTFIYNNINIVYNLISK